VRTAQSLAAELILAAEQKGVRIDQAYAMNYIEARKKLQTTPNDEAAQKTAKHFELLMSEFGRFALPIEDWEKHCFPLVQL